MSADHGAEALDVIVQVHRIEPCAKSSLKTSCTVAVLLVADPGRCAGHCIFFLTVINLPVVLLLMMGVPRVVQPARVVPDPGSIGWTTPPAPAPSYIGQITQAMSC